MENITNEIFSNVGVWGLEGEPLELDVQQSADEIVVALNTDRKEFLNLKSIQIYANGQDLIHSRLIKSALLSTDFHSVANAPVDVLEPLRQRRLLHSKFEVKPWVNIKLKKPVHIDKIVVLNRTGVCGLRSRTLEVKAQQSGACVYSYSCINDTTLATLKQELTQLLAKCEGQIKLPENGFYAQKYVRSCVYDALIRGENASEALLQSLLPVDGPAPLLDNYTALYITRFIERKLADSKNSHIVTSLLFPFSNILRTDVAIDALAAFASDYLSQKQGSQQKLVIGKHRVHLDQLVNNTAAVLDFLDDVFNYLDTTDGIPILAYGTLLGAVRDKAFLPADDDLDIILHYDDVPKEQRDSVKAQLVVDLREAGFSVTEQVNCPHITVNSAVFAIGVDLFLSWGSAASESVDVVMEQLHYRAIPRGLLFPTSNVAFYDRTYRSPASSDGFLASRYGAGWSRSNPYYEWPWKLKELKYFDDQELAADFERRQAQQPLRFNNSKTNLVAWSQGVDMQDRPPHNSVPMVKQAMAANFDVIEVDVLTTKDKQVVLAHDDTFTNKAGQKITISKSNLNEVLQFSLGEYRREEVTIPALSEVLPLVGDKRILLDARFRAEDYRALRQCIDNAKFDRSKLLFCVYNEDQLVPLMQEFPESVYLWKLYTQAWEADPLTFTQLAMAGLDGVMFMYPHFDEDISETLFHIRKNGLQSLCFIHGQNWTPAHSSGLSPARQQRTKDNYAASLEKMVALGINFVTTIDAKSPVFRSLTSLT